MSSSRISGWFVLSAVFVVAVFGLFFTFTERKTWPEHRTELSASDQRLIPPASTVWCEAVAIYSEHPFVAYQVSRSPLVNPTHLTRQKVQVAMKLGGGRSRNHFKLKYFLLEASVLEMYACASREGARLLVFRGEEGVQDYLLKLSSAEDSSSDSKESAEESAEENDMDCGHNKQPFPCRKTPSFLISESVVGVSEGEESMCGAPVKVNISAAGFYVVAALNTDPRNSCHFDLQLLIDRARYNVVKSGGHAMDMCALASSCTIGLNFASDDSVLVWIPEEANAGRSTFTVRSRCKPRLAVFALLSVFLPLIFFVLVAFFVRADRERLRRLYTRPPPDNPPSVAPLLTDDIPCRGEERPPEDAPPPYHSLYDHPPSYASLQPQKNNSKSDAHSK